MVQFAHRWIATVGASLQYGALDAVEFCVTDTVCAGNLGLLTSHRDDSESRNRRHDQHELLPFGSLRFGERHISPIERRSSRTNRRYENSEEVDHREIISQYLIVPGSENCRQVDVLRLFKLGAVSIQ
jgi:hypothetical protein